MEQRRGVGVGFGGPDPGDVAESKIVAETCVEIVRAFLSYELDTQAHFTLRPPLPFFPLLGLDVYARAVTV